MTKKDNNTPKSPLIEDAHLWEVVAKDIEPLAKATSSKKLEPHAAEVSTPIKTEHAHQNIKRPSISPQAKAITTGNTADVNRAMAKQIKAGKYPVDATLDLHGKTQVEAHQMLISAIELAYYTGKRCVLVITGKGKFTKGGGVLRRQLPLWLNQENLRPFVLIVNEAAQKDGGSGAFYVMIKRKR